MTFKHNRAPFLCYCYFKLCASFHSHWWFQTGVTVRKRPIWVKISDVFVPFNLEIWQMTLKSNRAPLLCYFKLCASFHSHWSIQTGVTVRKQPVWVKIGNFLSRVTLKLDRWPWKTIGHRFYATLSFVHHFIAIGQFKRMELQFGNAQIGAKFVLTSVTSTFDLWSWPFAWTSLLSMVITPENFMMIWWQEHCEKSVTDRQTDGQTKVFLELLGRR